MSATDPQNQPDETVHRQLQESLERFRALTENAFDLIAEVDQHGVYLYLSPNHREVLGWDVEAMIGTISLDQVHPDQRALVGQRLHQAVREGSGIAEFQILAANGQWRWFESTGQAYWTANNQMRFVLISRDTTARREAEERLLREQDFQRRLVAMQDADRRLMAYEIHDGLVQDTYGAQLFLESIHNLERLGPEDAKAFASALHLVRGAVENARRLINGLRPPILDEQGLVAALEHLANDVQQMWGLRVTLRTDVRFDRLLPSLENAVYRIVQEGLNNVVKHSGADRATVELTQDDECLQIVVEDAGKGFDPRNVTEKQYGLAGIRERARLLAGTAEIESQPGKGVRISVRLPLAELNESGVSELPAPDSCSDSE